MMYKKLHCNTKNKKLIFAAAAFVALVALVVAVFVITKPFGDKNEKTVTVTVVHSDGKETVKEITTKREFLADALIDEGYFTAQDIASGKTDVVDGETVDTTQQQWWYVLVNGKDLGLGMKEIPLKKGDQIRIEFTVGYEKLGF